MGLYDEVVADVPEIGRVLLQTKWKLYCIKGRVCALAYTEVERDGVRLWVNAYLRLEPVGEVVRLPCYWDCTLTRYRLGDLVGGVKIAGVERVEVEFASLDAPPISEASLISAGFHRRDNNVKVWVKGLKGAVLEAYPNSEATRMYLVLKPPRAYSEELASGIVQMLKSEVDMLTVLEAQ